MKIITHFGKRYMKILWAGRYPYCWTYTSKYGRNHCLVGIVYSGGEIIFHLGPLAIIFG